MAPERIAEGTRIRSASQVKQHHGGAAELEVLERTATGGSYTDTVRVYPRRLRAYTHTELPTMCILLWSMKTQVDGPLGEGLDVGSVVFSHSIFLTISLYFCFRSFSPARPAVSI